MTRQINCPSCGKPVTWVAESRWRPFCSERCKLVDLGDWATERHLIPGSESETPDDLGAEADQPSRRQR